MAEPAAAPARAAIDPGVVAAMIVMTVFWGSAFVAAKYTLAYVTPLTSAALRFGFAAIVFAPIVAVMREPAPRGREWWTFAALAATGVVLYNGLFFAGLAYSTASAGALIIPPLLPIATNALAALVLREPISRRKALGLALAAAGVALVVVGGQGAQGHALTGDLMFVGAVLAWAAYAVIGRLAMRTRSPLSATAWAHVLGGPVMVALAAAAPGWASLGAAPASVWLLGLYMGIFPTAVAVVLFNTGVHRLGPGRTTAFTYLVPVWALVLAAWILGEAVQPLQAVGGLVVAAGVWLASTG